MENQYDVGIANRYALFLEEGENELTAIKKKLTKELRAKTKMEKKENAEAKKTETVKAAEKPKKPEPAPTSDTTPSKKEGKENKTDNTKAKEKKQKDAEPNKRDRETQEKPRTYKNGPSMPETENWDDDTTITKTNDSAPPPRKNYENRKPRERKFDNNDQYQPKSYYSQKKFNKKDAADNNESGNGDAFASNDNEEWSARENGFEQPQNDYKPRGGGNRFRGSNRGGRGGYNGGERGDRADRGDRGDRGGDRGDRGGERGDRGGDRGDRGGDRGDRGERRRGYYENRHEVKDDADNNKNDTWGEETTENPTENTDNQDDSKTDGNAAGNNEQKEDVKEVMTLDEWKKIRGEREKPQYNLRKAGEGEDLSQWKNMRELQKAKETEFLENGYGNHHVAKKIDNDKENGGNENVQRVARQKHIDINIHFREPTTRGGRGGRMVRNNRFGFRGGRSNEERNTDGYVGSESRPNRKYRDAPAPGGRGGPRQHAPKITDERDFPTLG